MFNLRRINNAVQRKNFMETFDQDWTEFANSFFNDSNFAKLISKSKKHGEYPRVDISQTKENYCIDVSVPGVKKENLQVEIFEEDNSRFVKISGKMAEEYTKSEEEYFYVKELRRGAFSRILGIPPEAIGEPITKLADGVLSLSWPLKQVVEEEQVKKSKIIAIN
jgi:HSP20 family protein